MSILWQIEQKKHFSLNPYSNGKYSMRGNIKMFLFISIYRLLFFILFTNYSKKTIFLRGCKITNNKQYFKERIC